jgi:hypothetical protein
LHNNIKEWISKKYIQIDNEEEVTKPNENITTKHNVTKESENLDQSDISEQEEGNISDIQLNDTDSDSDGGEPQNTDNESEMWIRTHITPDDKDKDARTCWACGNKDSIHHILWKCTPISILHNDHEICTLYKEAHQEQIGAPTTQELEDWWMSWRRTQQERDTMGQFIKQTFESREKWCTRSGYRPQSVEEMIREEQTLKFLYNYNGD